MDSVDSSGRRDNVHGLCPLSPWTKSNVQWAMSIGSLDKVQGTVGHCPWTLSSLPELPGLCPLSPWTLSTDIRQTM